MSCQSILRIGGLRVQTSSGLPPKVGSRFKMLFVNLVMFFLFFWCYICFHVFIYIYIYIIHIVCNSYT